MLSVRDNGIFPSLASEVRDELLELPASAWDRYNNPFEQKWVLHKESYTSHMDRVCDWLHGKIGFVQELAGDTKLDLDADGHYTAFFKYGIGDYLDLHFDAQRHPLNKKAKVATLLLYLSTDDVVGGNFEIWHGGMEPLVSIEPTFNKLVAFEGPEIHGNPTCVESGVRLVCTISFLGSKLAAGRERAYFMPRVGLKEWSPEKFKLRDLRADSERYSEAYQVGGVVNASS